MDESRSVELHKGVFWHIMCTARKTLPGQQPNSNYLGCPLGSKLLA